MPRPKPQIIFEYLNNTKYIVPNTNTEYWLFSDLYNLFGKENVGSNEFIPKTVNTALRDAVLKIPKGKTPEDIETPEYFWDFYAKHLTTIIHNYTINTDKGIKQIQNGHDAKLSRFACWSILKRNPRLIFTELYFMMPNARFSDLSEASYKFSRIYLRNDLASSEKIVNGIAYRHKAKMGLFHQLMEKSFFYDIDIETLKNMYGIVYEPGDPISNYMGSRSLMAKQKALNIAVKRYDESKNMTLRDFSYAVTKELNSQRIKLFQKEGIFPEQDLTSEHIKNVRRDLYNKRQEFIKQFSNINIR